MRTLALLLGVHGFAHLVGFVVPWRLASLAEMPYKTTVFAGRVDAGDVGIRIVGLCWLAMGLTFFVAAWACAVHAIWATRLTTFAVAASLVLCLSGWPDSRIGVFVNIGLGAILAIIAVTGPPTR